VAEGIRVIYPNDAAGDAWSCYVMMHICFLSEEYVLL